MFGREFKIFISRFFAISNLPSLSFARTRDDRIKRREKKKGERAYFDEGEWKINSGRARRSDSMLAVWRIGGGGGGVAKREAAGVIMTRH